MQILNLGKASLKIGSGATPRGGKNSYLGGSVSLIRSLNVFDDRFHTEGLAMISDEQSRALNNVTVEEDDLLFNITGASIARCCIVPKDVLPARVNQHVAIIRTDKAILNPYYLHYYLILPEVKSNLLSASGGSSREAITKDQLEGLEFEVADINTQNSIAQTLTSLDYMIELNNKMIIEIENTARLIYDYWFIQYDFPDKNGKPYKSSGGSMVFNDHLKRDIPAGWNVRNFLEVAQWIGGAQPPKSTFKYKPAIGYVRFIQNRDYANSNNETYIPERSSNKLCDRYDILVDKYGDAGRTRYGLSGAYNVALARIKTNLNNSQEYIRKFLESESIYNYLYNACMASTRASLNEDILGNLYVAVPPDEILNEFELQQKNFINMILYKRQEIIQLSDLRDWLLPLLMTGQVSINKLLEI